MHCMHAECIHSRDKGRSGLQDTNAKASVEHLSTRGVGVAALQPYPAGPDDHEQGSLRQALVRNYYQYCQAILVSEPSPSSCRLHARLQLMFRLQPAMSGTLHRRTVEASARTCSLKPESNAHCFIVLTIYTRDFAPLMAVVVSNPR